VKGYHQVKTAPNDTYKTAFSKNHAIMNFFLPKVSYEVLYFSFYKLKMPFGSAP